MNQNPEFAFEVRKFEDLKMEVEDGYNKMKPKLYTAKTGSKITFKPMRLEDAPLIHTYASDEDVSRYIGWKLMTTIGETTAYVKEMVRREEAGTHLYASIYERDSGVLIGTGMLFNFDDEARQAEIGYVFHKDYWGKGYASEALNGLKEWIFSDPSVNAIFGDTDIDNYSSHKVLINAGAVNFLEKNDTIWWKISR